MFSVVETFLGEQDVVFTSDDQGEAWEVFSACTKASVGQSYTLKCGNDVLDHYDHQL